jgi:hypothetical protein
MAHAQKPDFVFQRNGRVHLNRRGASVQSTTHSRCVRISGSIAGYTMFRGSVKGAGYPLHSPVSPSLPLPCVTVCHHISTGLYAWFVPHCFTVGDTVTRFQWFQTTNCRYEAVTSTSTARSAMLRRILLIQSINMSLKKFSHSQCEYPVKMYVVTKHSRETWGSVGTATSCLTDNIKLSFTKFLKYTAWIFGGTASSYEAVARYLWYGRHCRFVLCQ